MLVKVDINVSGPIQGHYRNHVQTYKDELKFDLLFTMFYTKFPAWRIYGGTKMRNFYLLTRNSIFFIVKTWF